MPNNVNVNTFSQSWKDFGGEQSGVRHRVGVFADNVAYQDAQDQYTASLDALLLGNRQNTQASLSDTISGANATAQEAQREIKMLVRYAGASGKVYRVTYPCLDLSIPSLIVPGTDFINRELAVVQTFETEFENFVRTPDNEAAVIQSIQFVGRNS